jgi:hypothetical protein
MKDKNVFTKTYRLYDTDEGLEKAFEEIEEIKSDPAVDRNLLFCLNKRHVDLLNRSRAGFEAKKELYDEIVREGLVSDKILYNDRVIGVHNSLGIINGRIEDINLNTHQALIWDNSFGNDSICDNRFWVPIPTIFCQKQFFLLVTHCYKVDSFMHPSFNPFLMLRSPASEKIQSLRDSEKEFKKLPPKQKVNLFFTIKHGLKKTDIVTVDDGRKWIFLGFDEEKEEISFKNYHSDYKCNYMEVTQNGVCIIEKVERGQ